MTTKITEKGKEAFLDALTEKSENNPLCKIDGKIYMRFDKITIESKKRLFSSGIQILYCWNNTPVMYQETSGVAFENGSVLNLVGIDGKIEINFDF